MMGSGRRAEKIEQVTERVSAAVKQAGAGLIGAVVLAAVALLVAGVALLIASRAVRAVPARA